MKMKTILFVLFLLSVVSARSQSLEGTYMALELNHLTIDTSGQVSFFGLDSFPKTVWFHEVRITIKGDSVSASKSPVYFRNGEKVYSSSDGGFLYYKGVIRKNNDVYITNAKLVDFDYIGFSTFNPPMSSKGDQHQNINLAKFKKYKNKDGIEVYLPKDILSQNYIIRYDKSGIWVNNLFFISVK